MLVNGMEVSARDLSALAARLAKGGNHELATRIGLAVDGIRDELLLGRRDAGLVAELLEGRHDLAAQRDHLAEPTDETP